MVRSYGLVAGFHFWKLDKYIKVVWLIHLNSYWIFTLITKIPVSGQLHSAQSSLKTLTQRSAKALLYWPSTHKEPDPKCSEAQVMAYWVEKKYMQSSTIACLGSGYFHLFKSHEWWNSVRVLKKLPRQLREVSKTFYIGRVLVKLSQNQMLW